MDQSNQSNQSNLPIQPMTPIKGPNPNQYREHDNCAPSYCRANQSNRRCPKRALF